MLIKLIKYDLKKTFKFLIIFYSLAIFFATTTRILFNIHNSFIIRIAAQISNIITILMIINILINSIMRLWLNFKSSLYNDEAYLTHTLPISRQTIYLSKIILAVITMFSSILIIGLTLFIGYYSKENINMLKQIFIPLKDIFNINFINTLFSFLIIFFIQTLNITQIGYTGIIMGHKMNNIKVTFSVVFGFIAYLTTQIITLLIMAIICLVSKNIRTLFITNEIVGITALKTLVYICIFIYLFIFITNYLINIKVFKKGVDLE